MRLIDADALIAKKFVDREISGYGEGTAYRCGWNDAIEAICENEPTTDAVEVVRCKECKYWICNPNTEEWGKCKWISDKQFDVVMNADDYCSYGEREGE